MAAQTAQVKVCWGRRKVMEEVHLGECLITVTETEAFMVRFPVRGRHLCFYVQNGRFLEQQLPGNIGVITVVMGVVPCLFLKERFETDN